MFFDSDYSLMLLLQPDCAGLYYQWRRINLRLVRFFSLAMCFQTTLSQLFLLLQRANYFIFRELPVASLECETTLKTKYLRTGFSQI